MEIKGFQCATELLSLWSNYCSSCSGAERSFSKPSCSPGLFGIGILGLIVDLLFSQLFCSFAWFGGMSLKIGLIGKIRGDVSEKVVSSSFSCAEFFRKANKHPFGKKTQTKNQQQTPLSSLSDFPNLEFLSHTFSHSCCVFWSSFLSYWWFWEPKYSEICLVRLHRKQNFKGSWAPKPVLWVFCSFAWEGAFGVPKVTWGFLSAFSDSWMKIN